MEKCFLKVFDPKTAQRMKIPTGYTNYKNGKLPSKVSLRDRVGNMWPIGVIKTGRDLYFQFGWEKFIKDNILEFGDSLVFHYDGKDIFDFKLFEINGCEKGVEGGKRGEEMNFEHRKSVKLKEKNLASETSSNSFDDDSVKNYMTEEEDDDEEEEDDDEEEKVENKEEEKTEKVSRLKRRYMEEEEYDGEEGEKEDGEEIERADTIKKKTSRSKAECQKVIACKVRNVPDQYGADLFKSGCATQPKNPYFVTKIRPKKRDQLYVPIDVVRDYRLKLPPSMIIRDSAGREFKTRVNNWKTNRIWLVGGWHSLCRWNLVKEDDRCICEFVREKRSNGLYLQVQVLHEGSSSHPNNK